MVEWEHSRPFRHDDFLAHAPLLANRDLRAAFNARDPQTPSAAPATGTAGTAAAAATAADGGREHDLHEGRAQQLCTRVTRRIGDDWLVLTLLGGTVALLGVAVDFVIQWLLLLRRDMTAVHSTAGGYVVWLIFAVGCTLLATFTTQVISPHAVGSGIPQMKTILKGMSLPQYLSMQTLVAKAVGLTFAVGSGLPIGKEGPFVHMASIVAEQMMQRLFVKFASNESRRLELLAAACAVGVASNFAAPVGGVLFSIEVTATYFAVRNYWRGFYAALIGAFIFRLIPVLSERERTLTAMFSTTFDVYSYDLEELPVFIFVGVAAGLCGALFVFCHRKLIEFRRFYSEKGRALAFLQAHRYIYPALVTVIVASLSYPNFIGPYMGMTAKDSIDSLFSSAPLTCSKVWGEEDVVWKLQVFIAVQFMATLLAATLPIPAGVFVPVFVFGAATGRLIGECMAAQFPLGMKGDAGEIPLDAMCDDDAASRTGHIVAGGYALVGAAAMAGSVTHTISTSVIVMELTGQIHHIIPVMIAVLIANAICQQLSPSFYDSMIQIKRLPYLPDLRKGESYNTLARTMMRSNPVFLSLTSTYARLAYVLRHTSFSCYPLVDGPRRKVLLGAVSRAELEALLQKKGMVARANGRENHDDDGEVWYSHRLLQAEDPQEEEEEELLDADANEIDESDLGSAVGLADSAEAGPERIDFTGLHIDPSPFQIVGQTSLYKVHTLFSLLGIRIAYVTELGSLVGVVGIKEVRAAIEAAGVRTLEASLADQHSFGSHRVSPFASSASSPGAHEA
eukprot:m.55135 g.55135  ORF g.55135 m.55135 type:complete len:792 (-) comp13289_c0_seq1:390-2765(-)